MIGMVDMQTDDEIIDKLNEKIDTLKAKLEKAEAALEKLISAVEMVPFRDVYQDINEAKEALKELRGERAR